MTTAQEWEQEFDILYNSINSNIAPALDSYEKSVFLTMAQEQIVKALYTGGTTNGGFESSEATRRSLNNLIVETNIGRCGEEQNRILKSQLGNYIYVLPDDVLYIIAEIAKVDGKEILVVPTTHDEYYKIKQNPFRGPSATRILKLDSGLQSAIQLDTAGKGQHIELIGATEDTIYVCRYLKKPYPIILEDLTGTDDYINGKQTPHTNICELNESLHREILTTAISLAQSVYLSNSK